LRVIAGSRRGFRLRTADGTETRPITDRSKESLFGHLGPDRLVGAVVLDLFAGSGAMAIEALSRGAERALLVERSPLALDVIATNLAWTRFEEEARVHRGDVFGFLGSSLPAAAPFTLCFVDPPFAMPDEQVGTLLGRLTQPGWLDEADASIVLRRAKASGSPPLPAGWTSTWERTFGDTFVAVVEAG
jgi:16S rRNA (guanine966-N2)-methyltransferase